MQPRFRSLVFAAVIIIIIIGPPNTLQTVGMRWNIERSSPSSSHRTIVLTSSRLRLRDNKPSPCGPMVQASIRMHLVRSIGDDRRMDLTPPARLLLIRFPSKSGNLPPRWTTVAKPYPAARCVMSCTLFNSNLQHYRNASTSTDSEADVPVEPLNLINLAAQANRCRADLSLKGGIAAFVA